jgi:hypothetical protein
MAGIIDADDCELISSAILLNDYSTTDIDDRSSPLYARGKRVDFRRVALISLSPARIDRLTRDGHAGSTTAAH